MRQIARRSGLVGVGMAAAATLIALPSMGVTTGAAWAQKAAAPAEEPAPTQVKLTQKTIDQLIATQKQIRDAEASNQKGGKAADPKAVEAQVETSAKSNGFASMSDFANASYSVGLVLSGMDEGGNYIGTQAALKKQIDEINADKKMPPKEKKEALDELNDAMKSAGTEKPLPGNVDLVKTNIAKLSEGAQGD